MLKRAKNKLVSDAKNATEKKIDSIFPALCFVALILGILCKNDELPSKTVNYIVIKELKL